METKKNTPRIIEASFVISAPDLRHCPEPTIPEIAIAGRSNVGKSSLINQMCNRKNLAKTSSTPGKTRLINFFHLVIRPGDLSFHLVDLPGYGFSKADKKTQAHWSKALGEFMEQRPLHGILHLVDARHKPSLEDLQMREWIDFQHIPAITVITKMDKVGKNKRKQAVSMIRQEMALTEDEICVPTSTQTKMGTQELIQEILGLLPKPE